MSIKVSGIEKLGTVHGNFSPNVINFNAGVKTLVDDWAKTYSTLYAHRDGKQSALKLIKITPLVKLKTIAGQSNVQRASIEIAIKHDSLNNFPIAQYRLTKNNQILHVKKIAKHTKRTKKDFIVKSSEQTTYLTITRTKILKASSFSTVVVPKAIKASYLATAKAYNTKGFFYDKKSKVTAKDSTKSGIYIRTGVPYKRYSIAELQNIPIAYMFNSSRTTNTLGLDKRFAELSDYLKK